MRPRNATSNAPPKPTDGIVLGKPLANVVVAPVFGSTRVILPTALSVTYSAPPGPTVLPKLPRRPVTRRETVASPGGAAALAVGAGRRLNVWDPRTGEPVLTTAPAFVGAATSVRWLPDRHTVVYGGEDGRAALFDTDASVQRGVSLPVFADAGAGDVHIATAPDGQLALFGGYRPSAQARQGLVYPLTPSDGLAHACSIVHRDLTPAEWASYLPSRPYRPTCSG